MEISYGILFFIASFLGMSALIIMRSRKKQEKVAGKKFRPTLK